VSHLCSIFKGGDDERVLWTWECRLPHRTSILPIFADVPTFDDALTGLTNHQLDYHPVFVAFGLSAEEA
jgi:hypothetical protein